MESTLNIVPAPAKAIKCKGNFKSDKGLQIYSDNFKECLYIFSSIQFKMRNIYLEFALSKKDANLIIIYDVALKKDEYILNVSENIIKIKSSTESGIFYSLQTIKQIIQVKNKTVMLPCCKIHDYPRFEWRGFMLDESRHFFGKEFVKQTLDMMALNKMNVFHWHLTDDQGWRIEIKKYPLLTSKGSIRKATPLSIESMNDETLSWDKSEYGKGLYYTQKDILEIVSYAKERFIEIVPEIDMPGHLSAAISCYPELSCSGEKIDVAHKFGILENIACCGKENIYKFAYDIIDELTQLFPFRYIHIGGDEVPKNKWKECPLCQKMIQEKNLENEENLQGYFNNCLQAHIKSKGKHMIGWNEILKASYLSSDTVIQWWCDDSGKEKDWIENGNKAILSKIEYMYMDHLYGGKPLSKTYSFDLDSMGLSPESEKNILGIEAPLWTEYVRDTKKAHLNMYPRLQAVAEIAWTIKESRNFDSFLSRLQVQEKIMDEKNILRAKRNVYEPIGSVAKVRKDNDEFNFRNRPNYELKLNRNN